MSFSFYKEYKESNVEWLGKIPSGWTIKRIGLLFEERREKVSDKDFQPLSVTKHGVVPQLETAAKSDDGDNRKKVCIGDFVINSRSDRKGSSGASPLNGSVSLINTVITPNKDIDIKFAHSLFRSLLFQEEYYRYGKGIVADLWSTNYSEMKNISVAIPPFKEQQLITIFLDHETAKIDTLIAEQEKLVGLLLEKRQAVISHAVTKGLDPKAKMKNSGVEWLGQIPQHWNVRKGAAIGSLFGSEQITEEDISEVGEFPYLKVGSLSTDSFEIANWDWFISKKSSEKIRLRKNYIIFPKRGAAIFLNKVNIVEKLSAIDPNLMGWEIFEIAIPKFIGFILKTRKLEQLADVSTVPQINNKHISPELFPLPPLSEQKQIVNFIEDELVKIFNLLSTAEMVINLLQERRSALISAAVTGQIDVRNYQIKEVA
jgi:type I restriction enzyme S subunit